MADDDLEDKRKSLYQKYVRDNVDAAKRRLLDAKHAYVEEGAEEGMATLFQGNALDRPAPTPLPADSPILKAVKTLAEAGKRFDDSSLGKTGREWDAKIMQTLNPPGGLIDRATAAALGKKTVAEQQHEDKVAELNRQIEILKKYSTPKGE
jgi:hypothetical protein